MNIGEVKDFDTKPFLEAAEWLCRADEPERALRLLENLPAYYRDHMPNEVSEMRRDILGSLLTPHAYASVDFDSEVGRDVLDSLLRGRMVKKTLDEIKGPVHIVEMGPGEYWLPIGLSQRGYEFTYHDISLLQRTGKQAREIVPSVWKNTRPGESDLPKLFVAFEIIEHLADPKEIATEAARHCGTPDYIFLSTPLYTFDTKTHWRKPNGQPHLRAYTPSEFVLTANQIFPGYKWELEADQIMVLKGTRNVLKLG